MKIAAIMINVVLLGFTCLVMLTDGLSGETAYGILAALLVVVPLLNVVLISRSGTRDHGPEERSENEVAEEHGKPVEKLASRTGVYMLGIALNVLLLALAVWANIDQYPHPQEAGFIEFGLLVLLTPFLSALVILRCCLGNGRRHQTTELQDSLST